MPSTFVYGSICVPLISAYLPVKSVKVLCLFTCDSLLFICLPFYNLTFHFLSQIVADNLRLCY